MSRTLLYRQFLGIGKKCFALLLIFSFFISTAPAPALFAHSSTADLNTAASMQTATGEENISACNNLRSLAVNGTVAQSAALAPAATTWIKFTVQRNARYRLAVDNATGLQLAIHDRCDSNAPAAKLHDGQLEFTATRDGDYYLLVKQDSSALSAGRSGYQVTLSPAAPHRPSFVPLQDVPEAVLRRAIEFLEELRGGDLAPEWVNARVNPAARILYRPDIQEPAYYEFTVEKPQEGGGFEPAGFIQLAAGEHDYPVTHWDATGMSPTQELEELAPIGQITLTQFYKLDALSYAAEYEEATVIGISGVATDVLNVGDLPGRIEGLDALPLEPAELVSESIDSEGNVGHEGPEELPLTEQEDWESWAALKAGYKEEYAPLLESLRQDASEAWELEANLEQYGESLIKGDVRIVHALPAQTVASIQVTGPGADAQFLQQEQLSAGGVITGVRLTVLAEPVDPNTYLPFEVGLQYTSGATETVKYAIVNLAALNVNPVYLPIVSNPEDGNLAHSAEANATRAVMGDWGPWRYWWADGDANSFTYGQMSANSAPNTSGCASGCGGTAWAMLFGWVDRRAAEGHPRWSNHWGLYRENGGLGANVVAPLFQDGGVRNMTWEIRNRIGTFCIFGSGATWPWNMIDAADYVRPRASAAWRMQTKYDPTGLCWFGACDRNRDLAKDAIVNRRQPAIVGTGWLKHYPLAFGYAERSRRSCILFVCWTDHSRWFYVNNGWYGNDNGWTSATVWFAGTYYNN